MGNADTKLNFRKAVVQLTSKSQPIDAADDSFWDQFWSESVTNVQDVFALVPGAEIRALREESPNNLATLVYKAVEKLVKTVDSSCRTQREQQTALNCARLLTRVLPYMLEEPEWHSFFWSSLPAAAENEQSIPLAQSLINAICDLLFCPDFTVASTKRSGPERAEELSSLDSCEYIWAGGVGFARSPPRSGQHEAARAELLRLLLTCFSETIYKPAAQAATHHNQWIAYLTSSENRHALPLFTSLLNTVCAYEPAGLGLPYNHLLFSDSLEPLVEVALQILIVTLDHDTSNTLNEDTDESLPDNLFINYLSRIHRDEDFQFLLRGVTRLLNNPLTQTYLPNSAKKVSLHQELLVLFWKMCDYNKKFMYYVLKSSDVLEVLVPILYHLNDSRADQSRVGLMHIGVFILLLLSGERNFGVRLNKPYTATIPMDIPVFTGTHADLLVVVFHKIITTGHQRLQPLFDCLLTVLVNVSPYLKTLSMVSATKLLHLLEAFSTPWFLFSQPHHHHLVFFLLEMFNNMIQYQFDGNSNLVYTIIRKRGVFHNLANLPQEHAAIARSLAAGAGKGKTFVAGKGALPRSRSAESVAETPMEGSHPAQPASPGTLNATLPDTPAIAAMTERESAHPSVQQLEGGERLLPARSGGDGQDRADAAPAPAPAPHAPRAHDEDSEYRRRVREQETLRERVLRAKEVRRRKNAVALQKQIDDRDRDRQEKVSPKPEEGVDKPAVKPEQPDRPEPEVRPDTTRTSPERPAPVRERSPIREEVAEVNSTCETLTPPRASPERALTPPLPGRRARDAPAADTDDDLDLILGDIDGILSDDDDSGRFKSQPAPPPDASKPAPADLRARLPPRDARRPPRQKIVFGDAAPAAAAAAAAATATAATTATTTTTAANTAAASSKHDRKRERSPPRKAVVTSSTKTEEADNSDRKSSKVKPKSESSSNKQKQRITFTNKEQAEKERQKPKDDDKSYPSRRVIIQRKTAAARDKSVFARIEGDPAGPHPAIFSRAVRTAIGRLPDKPAPEPPVDVVSESDEEAPPPDDGHVALVTNLPHGITDTRLRTLAGAELQSVAWRGGRGGRGGREGRGAALRFASARAAAHFQRKFHNKLVAASRLAVSLR